MKLERSAEDKWIAGVAGGLAKSLGVDSTIVRIVFAVTSMFWGGGLFVYLALWAIMPRPTGGTIAEDGLHKAQEWNVDRKNRKSGSGDGSDFTI
ncbi:MAG: PspC domain-containing protein [Arachnia sp.]